MNSFDAFFVANDLRMTHPLAATLIAKLAGQKELGAALPFFHCTEKVSEAGDPTAANDLLGQPNTTLEQWCQQQTV